jgi:ESCRT-II complex subunit VPS25
VQRNPSRSSQISGWISGEATDIVAETINPVRIEWLAAEVCHICIAFRTSFRGTVGTVMGFAFPGVYSFPPFWTLQDVMETKRRQIDMWCDLILRYTKAKKLDVLDVTAALGTELFRNASIKRYLDRPTAEFFLERLVERRNAEWVPAGEKKAVKLIWRRPEQWADIFTEWATRTSFKNTVLTFWELREGDCTLNEPFHLMDMGVMRQTFDLMEKQNRAKVMPGPSPDKFDEYAVKFL